MQFRLTSLLLAAFPLAIADIKVTVPVPGSSVAGTGSLAITFADAGGSPPLDQIGTVKITLFAGGNKPGVDTMVVAVNSQALAGSAATLPLTPAKGPVADGTLNGFYLMIESTPKAGGAGVVNYSNRFTLTGMTGAWSSPDVKAAAVAAGVNPANVPAGNGGSGSGSDSSSNNAGSGDSGGSGGNGDPHPKGTWPAYSMQASSTVKFAPMQGRPGTKITQTNTAPLYPITAWSVFTTRAPIPLQVTTQTPSQTYSAQSRENTNHAAAAPSGANDMERWLNRWKD